MSKEWTPYQQTKTTGVAKATPQQKGKIWKEQKN